MVMFQTEDLSAIQKLVDHVKRLSPEDWAKRKANKIQNADKENNNKHTASFKVSDMPISMTELLIKCCAMPGIFIMCTKVLVFFWALD